MYHIVHIRTHAGAVLSYRVVRPAGVSLVSGLVTLVCFCVGFYRAKRSVSRYCHDKLSVRPSVRPSVTLVDCDHTRWNSAKIISGLISLGTWLSADINITDLLQREHP